MRQTRSMFGKAIENVEETEGQDLWISSVEVAVIESARERFLSDWERAVPSVDRINELEKGKPIVYKDMTISRTL